MTMMGERHPIPISSRMNTFSRKRPDNTQKRRLLLAEERRKTLLRLDRFFSAQSSPFKLSLVTGNPAATPAQGKEDAGEQSSW